MAHRLAFAVLSEQCQALSVSYGHSQVENMLKALMKDNEKEKQVKKGNKMSDGTCMVDFSHVVHLDPAISGTGSITPNLCPR